MCRGKTNTEAELRRSRDKAWAVVKSRKHWIDKVYAANAQGSDLMCFGRVHMDLVNGKDLESAFACRFKIRAADGNDPQVEFFTVWAVRLPWSLDHCKIS